MPSPQKQDIKSAEEELMRGMKTMRETSSLLRETGPKAEEEQHGGETVASKKARTLLLALQLFANVRIHT